jgi:hypothetical protein
MLAYLFPNARESICKLDDMLVLGTFSDFTEAGMVTVLLSALGIATGRLDVAVRGRTDLDVRPCGWDGERLDASEDGGLGQLGAIGADVGKTLSRLPPGYARSGVRDVSQPGGLGRVLRVDDRHDIGS